MASQSDTSRPLTPKDFMDTMIRLGLIVLLVTLCLRVFSPFINLMVWALVLAIALYPVHQMLAKRLGGRQGRASTSIVVLGLLLIGGPVVVLGSSFAANIKDLYTAYKNDELVLQQPGPNVAGWPLVGETIYTAWGDAADNLPAYVEQNRAAIDDFAGRALAVAASTATGILLFLVALIIAGIMMSFGQAGSAAMKSVFCKFAGPDKGPDLQKLSTMTVRSVAAGVVGVAFIQAILLGLGFLFSGIPAAGLLTAIALIIGIVQLPALVIVLPAVAYLWTSGDASAMSNGVWTVYLLVAGLSDNILKPMLLGRGVDVPMPVILLGALGGMFTAGIIGLFIGAALLALGYQIFMEWVGSDETIAASGQEATADE